MIRKQRQLFYFVGEKPYASLEEAQKADLMALMPVHPNNPLGMTNDGIADWMIKNSAAIVDTLTTTPKSRLRGRKLHGGARKPKTPKAEKAEA